MREVIGDLLGVMGDQHDRRCTRVARQIGKPVHEVFPGREIETCGRFVQQQHTRVGHQRPGELDPLPFAGRQRPEATFGQVGDTHPIEFVPGPGLVGCGVTVPPRLERAVLRGDDHVARGQVSPELIGERLAGHADARTQAPHVGPPQRFVQHPDHALGGMQVQRRHPQQGRLARAVVAEHDPTIAGSNRPGEITQHHVAAALDHDVLEFDGGGHRP